MALSRQKRHAGVRAPDPNASPVSGRGNQLTVGREGHTPNTNPAWLRRIFQGFRQGGDGGVDPVPAAEASDAGRVGVELFEGGLDGGERAPPVVREPERLAGRDPAPPPDPPRRPPRPEARLVGVADPPRPRQADRLGGGREPPFFHPARARWSACSWTGRGSSGARRNRWSRAYIPPSVQPTPHRASTRRRISAAPPGSRRGAPQGAPAHRPDTGPAGAAHAIVSFRPRR